MADAHCEKRDAKPPVAGDAPMDALAQAAHAATSRGLPPVHLWNPPYCGDIGLAITKDGAWWRHGSRITRMPLVRLFSTILRKDEDGRHYLVTPVEKVDVTVEVAPFLAVRVDRMEEAGGARLRFTTNLGDVTEIGPDRPLRVETDPETLEPTPFVLVRGRLEALLTRPVYYELVDMAEEREADGEPVLGVESGGVFFPLGPPGAHLT